MFGGAAAGIVCGETEREGMVEGVYIYISYTEGLQLDTANAYSDTLLCALLSMTLALHPCVSVLVCRVYQWNPSVTYLLSHNPGLAPQWDLQSRAPRGLQLLLSPSEASPSRLHETTSWVP